MKHGDRRNQRAPTILASAILAILVFGGGCLLAPPSHASSGIEIATSSSGIGELAARMGNMVPFSSLPEHTVQKIADISQCETSAGDRCMLTEAAVSEARTVSFEFVEAKIHDGAKPALLEDGAGGKAIMVYVAFPEITYAVHADEFPHDRVEEWAHERDLPLYRTKRFDEPTLGEKAVGLGIWAGITSLL